MFIKYSKGTIKDIHQNPKEAIEEIEKDKKASENNEKESEKEDEGV